MSGYPWVSQIPFGKNGSRICFPTASPPQSCRKPVRGKSEQDGPEDWSTLDAAEIPEKLPEPEAKTPPAPTKKTRKKKKEEKPESDLDKTGDV